MTLDAAALDAARDLGVNVSAVADEAEALKRFDIAVYGNVAMVVVESDLLPPDPAVVVIPLLPDYPAVRHLNPEIRHGGSRLVLATRLIASVRRSGLRYAGSAAQQGDEITRAIDVLMAGSDGAAAGPSRARPRYRAFGQGWGGCLLRLAGAAARRSGIRARASDVISKQMRKLRRKTGGQATA